MLPNYFCSFGVECLVEDISFSSRVSMMFRVWVRTSLTVDISVAGALIVGK